MDELIRIITNGSQDPIVSGRELHQFLELGTEYRHWFPRMLEYGFAENVDYTPVIFEHPANLQPITDHHLTLDMAKEICMIQRNEKGKEARLYFIQVEKKFRNPQTIEDLIIMQAQSVKELKTKVEQLTLVASSTQETVTTIKDTIIERSDNWREDLNKMLNRIVETIGGERFRELRNESYKTLELRAGVKLEARLENHKTRLVKAGAGRTKVNNACKLDVIAEDKKLKEIYSKIVQELYIKYVA